MAKTNPSAAEKLRDLYEWFDRIDPNFEWVRSEISRLGKENLKIIAAHLFEGRSDEQFCDRLYQSIQAVNEEHQLIDQIADQLDVPRTISFVEKLTIISGKIDGQRTAMADSTAQLRQKLKEISHELVQRNDYVAELETKVRDTNAMIEQVRVGPNCSELQSKLRERDALLRSIQEQLRLVDSDPGGIFSEIVRIEKVRKVASIAQNRLKQIALKLASWAQQFQTPPLGELSKRLLAWYHTTDPMEDVYDITCQILDAVSATKGCHEDARSSSSEMAQFADDVKAFARQHSPLLIDRAQSWEDYCGALIYEANREYRLPIPQDVCCYFVQQLRVQKLILVRAQSDLLTPTKLPLLSVKPLLVLALFVNQRKRQRFPNAAAALERLRTTPFLNEQRSIF
jgi:hypothetical protein